MRCLGGWLEESPTYGAPSHLLHLKVGLLCAALGNPGTFIKLSVESSFAN